MRQKASILSEIGFDRCVDKRGSFSAGPIKPA
jgi:hypothetical protein